MPFFARGKLLVFIFDFVQPFSILVRRHTVKMGKLTSTIGIPIKLLNEAQVRYIP